MKLNTLFLFTAATAVSFGSAGAAIVNYSADGWSQQFPASITPPANAPWGPNGYPGDTVALQAYAGTLDLTPGTSTQKINSLLWTIDYTYGGTENDPNAWSDLHFVFNAVRNLTIDGVTGSIGQGGNLDAQWDNDYLSLGAGSTLTFTVQGYQVAVKPLALGSVGGSNFDGGNPWVQPSRDVYAEFTVSAVPEPSTYIAGALLLLPFGLQAMRRRTAGQ